MTVKPDDIAIMIGELKVMDDKLRCLSNRVGHGSDIRSARYHLQEAWCFLDDALPGIAKECQDAN